MVRYLTTCALSIALGALIADRLLIRMEHRYHQQLRH